MNPNQLSTDRLTTIDHDPCVTIGHKSQQGRPGGLTGDNTTTGGNQREQDRLKAQKKAAAQKKPKESNANLAKRKEAYVPVL